MTQGFASLRIGGNCLSRWLAGMLGVASIFIGLYLILSILLGQVDALAAAWPRYFARLQSFLSRLTEWLGAERSAKLQRMMAEIDLTRSIPALLASTQSFFVSLLLILAYIGFLATERPYIQGKIDAMFPDQAHAKEMIRLIAHLSESFHC
jgi:predicted PurR-regulated permease PerM